MSTLLLDVLKKYKKNNIFLETGSYKGGGIEVALAAGFKKIISIEINPEYHNICKEKFKNNIENGSVELFLGDTLNVLKEILPKLESAATFWLDAHIDWECNISGITPSPLVFELNLIKKYNEKNLNHTILIDDMRVFRTKVGWGAYNPVSEEEIKDKILNMNSNYKICYEKNSVQDDDVLVAYFD